MHEQLLLPLAPRIHHIERARTPVVQARHAREHARLVPRRDRVRLEYRQRDLRGVALRVQALREVDVGQVQEGSAACWVCGGQEARDEHGGGLGGCLLIFGR
jgi:hypothetical protein